MFPKRSQQIVSRTVIIRISSQSFSHIARRKAILPMRIGRVMPTSFQRLSTVIL